MKNKEQGITLVALVVTIIILLILAGVAINMALGDNGLFKKSKEAVNTWKSAEANETQTLDYLDREWDNLINGGISTGNPPTSGGPVLTGATVDDIVLPKNSETSTTITIGSKEVTIPPQFTIAKDSGKTVPEGIVAVDPQGNEWVWIPCYVSGGKGSNIEGTIQYKRTAFTYGFSSEKDDIISKFTEELSTDSDEYKSIFKYGGYYIGRYEAGDKELSELEVTRKRAESDKGDAQTHKVSIKKNQIPYNYVTQEQCKQLSEGMISANGNDTTLDGRKVFTKLCSSYSWDTAIMFIQEKHPNYGGTNKTNTNQMVDNTDDYTETLGLLNTGSKGSVCSIYDMGGNVYEYTTETSTESYGPYVYRGGESWIDAFRSPSGARISRDGRAEESTGFRVTMFLK